jgi:hypothetical protein
MIYNLYIFIIYIIIRLIFNILHILNSKYDEITLYLKESDYIFNKYIDKNYLKEIINIDKNYIKQKSIKQFKLYYNNINDYNLKKKALFTYFLIDYDILYEKNNKLIKMYTSDNYNNCFRLVSHNSNTLFSSYITQYINKMKASDFIENKIINSVIDNINDLNNNLLNIKSFFNNNSISPIYLDILTFTIISVIIINIITIFYGKLVLFICIFIIFLILILFKDFSITIIIITLISILFIFGKIIESITSSKINKYL